MRVDAARDLKRALRDGDVPLPPGAVDRPDMVDAAAATPGAFVGIVPSTRPDGFRVALRLTRPVAHPDSYAAAVRERAGEDVDIRYVGPVRALTGPPPPDPDPDPGTPTPTPDQLQRRVRPLVRGASIAHRDVTAGTLGAFVTVGAETAIYVLSNNHVLGNSDRGRIGDDVLQPGPADDGTSADRVGELFHAVRLELDAPNLVDAALALLDAAIEVDGAAHDGPLAGITDAAGVVGEVIKIGRTTGLTIGRISAIEVDGVPVGYDTGVFRFDDQIEVEGIDGGFSAGGDSGSVIYTPVDRMGVGLLFAGSTSGGPEGSGVTYANSLATVLSTLDAALLAEDEDCGLAGAGDAAINPVPPP